MRRFAAGRPRGFAEAVAAMSEECRRVVYRGRVQGVGFRATARQIARGHAVSGFVRNLDDGRVELMARGETGAVDAFLDEVARTFGATSGGSTSNRARRAACDLEGFTDPLLNGLAPGRPPARRRFRFPTPRKRVLNVP